MACPAASRDGCHGFGMPELLIALLLFSTAVAGLMSTQLAAKRALHEAHQRSLATALASDLLARLRGNPGQLAAYQTDIPARPLRPAPPPSGNCRQADCTPEELAAFDLWQWEQALLGAAERSGLAHAGGLPQARACLHTSGNLVRVILSWRGLVPSRGAAVPTCAGEPPGLYDAAGGEPGNDRLRRAVLLTTYLGGAP